MHEGTVFLTSLPRFLVKVEGERTLTAAISRRLLLLAFVAMSS